MSSPLPELPPSPDPPKPRSRRFPSLSPTTALEGDNSDDEGVAPTFSRSLAPLPSLTTTINSWNAQWVGRAEGSEPLRSSPPPMSSSVAPSEVEEDGDDDSDDGHLFSLAGIGSPSPSPPSLVGPVFESSPLSDEDIHHNLSGSESLDSEPPSQDPVIPVPSLPTFRIDPLRPQPDSKNKRKQKGSSYQTPSLPRWNSHSSPVKDTVVKIKSRKHVEKHVKDSNFYQDPRFTQKHLHKKYPGIMQRNLDVDLWQDILDTGTRSDVLATPLADLLTIWLQRAWEQLDPSTRPAHPFVCLETQHNPPKNHPYNDQDREDILVVPGPVTDYTKVNIVGRTDYRDVPFCKVHSIIEVKPKGKNGLNQVASYAFQLLEARPSLVGTYVLWARPSGYQILWVDASGGIYAHRFKWNKLNPLAAYVTSLYSPPQRHTILDPTITPTKIPGPKEICTWTIKDRNSNLYEGCEPLSVGTSWGRRTAVFKHTDASGEVVIIKESYPRNTKWHSERDIILHIHREGIFPGVVRLLFTDDQSPSPQLHTAPPCEGQTRSQRTKVRVFFGSSGIPLSEATSVLDLLMAVYDILEILRVLIRLNVIHRDITPWNIAIYPTIHPLATMGKAGLIKDPPTFISQILGINRPGNGADKSIALLLDFDNSKILRDDKPSYGHPAMTGSPMFVPRSVAKASVSLPEDHSSDRARFQYMPTLDERAREVYEGTYGSEMYDQYCDKDSKSVHGTISRIKLGRPENNQLPLESKPRHDVESLCWVLIYMLLHAQPSEGPEDKNLQQFWSVRKWFTDHRISKGTVGDSRDPFFSASVWELERALHPGLAPLAGLIRDVLRQLRPEYDALDPPPVPEHLHEALRRLLLKAILEVVEDPISLTGVSRPLEEGTEGNPNGRSKQDPRVEVRYSDDDSDNDNSSHDENGGLGDLETNSSEVGDAPVEREDDGDEGDNAAKNRGSGDSSSDEETQESDGSESYVPSSAPSPRNKGIRRTGRRKPPKKKMKRGKAEKSAYLMRQCDRREMHMTVSPEPDQL